MVQMRDSDWSREFLLRSDWLLIIGATFTTIDNAKVQQISYCVYNVFIMGGKSVLASNDVLERVIKKPLR